MTPEDPDPITEPNHYLNTLASAKQTVTTCGEDVHSGYGSPLDAIANPLASGGWVCPAADEWIATMREQCAGIPEGFDDAATTIQQRINAEPDRVPENDWRGNNWPRQWAMQQTY